MKCCHVVPVLLLIIADSAFSGNWHFNHDFSGEDKNKGHKATDNYDRDQHQFHHWPHDHHGYYDDDSSNEDDSGEFPPKDDFGYHKHGHHHGDNKKESINNRHGPTSSGGNDKMEIIKDNDNETKTPEQNKDIFARTISLIIQQCIRNCPVTSEFNPVCGTVECERSCGIDVSVLLSKVCKAMPVVTPRPVFSGPTESSEELEQATNETLLAIPPNPLAIAVDGTTITTTSSTTERNNSTINLFEPTWIVRTVVPQRTSNSTSNSTSNPIIPDEVLQNIFSNGNLTSIISNALSTLSGTLENFAFNKNQQQSVSATQSEPVAVSINITAIPNTSSNIEPDNSSTNAFKFPLFNSGIASKSSATSKDVSDVILLQIFSNGTSIASRPALSELTESVNDFKVIKADESDNKTVFTNGAAFYRSTV